MGDAKRSGFSRSRRRFVIGAGAATVVGLRAPALLAATQAPIKLGILNGFTGPISVQAESTLTGMKVHFDSIGWKVAGRTIELIVEDDQFNPQIGLEKARKFVDSDKVAMIVGSQASNVTLALLNYIKQTKAFLVVSGAGADEITWQRIPYLFRTSVSTWQLSSPMADWVYNNLAKEIVLSASDYAGGHDVLTEFKGPFLAKGGKVLKEIYAPLNTTDFSPYLTVMRSLNPPATYDFYPGADALRFMQQYDAYGLKKTAPLTGFTLIDTPTLAAGGKATLGVITAATYTDTLDNPANRRFVEEYQAKAKRAPDLFADYGFVAARVIAETLKQTDGDTSNKDKLAQAMARVSFDAPRGPFRFDPVTHNPIQNVYVCKVEEIDGQLQNKDIFTVVNVRDPGKKQY